MSNTTRLLKSVATKQGKILEYELYYHLGGMNYFTGEVMHRGLYFSITPVERTKESKTVWAFTGTCILVQPLNRFSQKALDSFEVDSILQSDVLRHVLAKNKLELA